MSIVVDALNYVDTFLPFENSKYTSPQAVFEEGRLRVQEFRKALEEKKMNAIFVFDNGQHTTESDEKWIRRRLDEVANEDRQMPCDAPTVLWALVKNAGFEVYYPPNIDGDDAVAIMAHKMHGIPMSRDQDLWRYKGLKSKEYSGFGTFPIVYTTFAYGPRGIEFQERTGVSRTVLAKLHNKNFQRPIDTVSFPENWDDWERKGCSLVDRCKTTRMRCGNPDNYTRRYGNLHLHARPLRAALYARLGLELVHEKLPMWNESAEMKQTSVVATKKYDHVLASPQSIFAFLYERCGSTDEIRQKRTHSVAMVSAELYVAAKSLNFTWEGQDTACMQYEYYKTLMSKWTPVERDEGWNTCVPCKGLGNRKLRDKSCKGSGLCYPRSAARAKQRGKSPLCETCIVALRSISRKR